MKRIITWCLFICCGLVAAQAQAQVTVTGSVQDKTNGLVLPYASVTNKTTGRRTYTDKGGFYKISASSRDVIVFSFVGYKPDSITVVMSSGTETRDISMTVEATNLPSIKVSSQYTPYQADSLQRRQQFGYILDLPNHQLAGENTPQGAGIVFSPFTRYSRKEKQKREFKKIFYKAEQDRYVDSRYTPAFVTQVTRLTGDSLHLFMQSNYPDYDLLRSMPTADLIYWTTDHYKAWIKK
jgi:hypothetical protein